MAKRKWRKYPLVDEDYWNFYNGIYTGKTPMPGRRGWPDPDIMVKLMETAAEKAPGAGMINLKTPDGTIHTFDTYPLELCPPAELAAKVGRVTKNGKEDLKAAAAYIYQIKELVMGSAFFTFDELMDLGTRKAIRAAADFDLRLIKTRYRSLDVIEAVWKAVTADYIAPGTYSPKRTIAAVKSAGLTEGERIMDDDDKYWLITNDTCRHFIEDYNRNLAGRRITCPDTPPDIVTYGHYTRKDERADIKRMDAETGHGIKPAPLF